MLNRFNRRIQIISDDSVDITIDGQFGTQRTVVTFTSRDVDAEEAILLDQKQSIEKKLADVQLIKVTQVKK